MLHSFELKKRIAPESFVGARFAALGLRDELEALLARYDEIVIDFSGVEATQSFLDEFIGVLVLENGSAILRRLRFRGCSANMKALLNFVVSDRAHQHSAHRPQ